MKKSIILFSLIPLYLSGCAVSKPCSEAGDVTWEPKIVGDKLCTQKKDKEGKYVNDGAFRQIYGSNRKMALEGQFEMGKKQGIWLFYSEDQQLKMAKYFEQGVEKTPPPEVQKKIDLIIHQNANIKK
jgi:antitoxin component YwqK of YwqJK toxin-antitoxin module